MLLPPHNLTGNHLTLRQRFNLKQRSNINYLTTGGQNSAYQAFAGIPVHAGKITQVSAGIEIDGRNLMLTHIALRFVDTAGVFGFIYRAGVFCHVGQCRQCRRFACPAYTFLHALLL